MEFVRDYGCKDYIGLFGIGLGVGGLGWFFFG